MITVISEWPKFLSFFAFLSNKVNKMLSIRVECAQVQLFGKANQLNVSPMKTLTEECER